MSALNNLAMAPRWIAWRNEMRAGKPTKVPYSPRGGPAKANDPATWATREAAEIAAKHLVNGQGGGVGIQLGDMGGDAYLAGLDLDSCIDEAGALAPWAAAIIEAVPSYAETSPSGTGVKLFFYLVADEVRPFLGKMGVDATSWGCRRDAPGADGRDHGPAVELYAARRYFAVTGQRWPTAPDTVALLDTDQLDRLAALIPPPKTATSGAASKAGSGDGSRSAAAFRLAARMRRAGATFDAFCAACRTDPETAAWCRDKGEAAGGRELRRAWDRAGAPVDQPDLSEDALALQFTARHADALRFVAQWGQWLEWRSPQWAPEQTLRAFDLARIVARDAANSCPANNDKPKIANAKTVAAIERLARADRQHAATVDQWDTDTLLIATRETVSNASS